MALRHTSKLDDMLKGNRLEEAAQYAHDLAFYASKKHAANSTQNQLFEPYKDDIKTLKYVHMTDREIEAEIKRAEALERVNAEMKNQILSTVMDEVDEQQEK